MWWRSLLREREKQDLVRQAASRADVVGPGYGFAGSIAAGTAVATGG
jgi:hypothetical protein